MLSTSSPVQVTWREVRSRRLARHSLAAPGGGGTAADVASANCGAHAQVMSAAELSVATRMDGDATRQDVREALRGERPSLVKAHGPRGTIHLLAARDLPMWTRALSAVPSVLTARSGLTAEQIDEIVRAVADALDGTALTIAELDEAVVERTGPWAGERVMPAFQDMWPRWRQALALAGHRGALCYGPNRGRSLTYTSPATVLPGFRPVRGPEPDEEQAALAELVTRYLHAYGPVTPQEFARWLAAPAGWAVRLFESMGERITRVDVDGLPGWVVAGDTGVSPEPPGGVRLLPYFDAYTVGCHPRERVFPGRAAERALARGQGGNYPVLLVDGTVAGVWHQRRSGRRIEVTVEPLDDLSPALLSDLDREVERIGRILEGVPRLTVGPVTVGPHA
ncbi:winged helix DNA-binding domain-containing protein [Spongiactinospora sp. TRM90649]|uniref:winged helix DNA-binding domain-containing protein n=1 Tax=Spongiactinospora sp. TRM90649 TaxID=3031114 RepID=UPI0023F85E04|nr:winged helix DNA-binding domain-containing protein [Spongiactinospora sp. TRM90649]MDF5751872.1 winged helix DNA-binding domain-containing protein [Spongiactinospora sp. TRM90649]